MIIKRGEVCKFRVSRKETEGTEQEKNRPAIIISTNRLNKKKVRYVAVPITSKKSDIIRDFEFPVLVESKKSKVLCDQVRVYNKSRIVKKIGNLSEKEMKETRKRILSLLEFWGVSGFILRNL